MMSDSAKWFHLSVNPDLPNPITTVQLPGFDYSDVDKPCWCLAPTVWQCTLAIHRTFSDTKEYFIYEFHVDSPRPATDTADYEIVEECRVTAEVLETNGGRIRNTKHGRLTVNSDLATTLKIARRMVPDLRAFDERTLLWTIRDGVWQPRFRTATDVQDAVAKTRKS